MVKRFWMGAAAMMLAGCASTQAPVRGPTAVTGAWTFTFDAGPGVATATLSRSNGMALAQVTCQAPRGPVWITDWTIPGTTRGVTLTIGAASSQAAVVPVEREDRPAVMLRYNPSDPVFQGIFAGAPVALTPDPGRTMTWPADSASQINTVLNACIARGS